MLWFLAYCGGWLLFQGLAELVACGFIYLVRICQMQSSDLKLRFTVCVLFSFFHVPLSSLLLPAALVQLVKEQQLLLPLRFQIRLSPPQSCPIGPRSGAFSPQEVGVGCLGNQSSSPKWSQQGLRTVNGGVQHLWRASLDQLLSSMKHCSLLRWKHYI